MEDLLDDYIEIIDQPDPEHKKSMYPYVEPTVQTADEIGETQLTMTLLTCRLSLTRQTTLPQKKRNKRK